ncbi:MAG TPA: hypothetical protein VF787_03620 [Thermoanaerobaculia bacterium]
MSQPYLIVAHPGHELMVHGWVEETRPRVAIITDGSGRTGVSRIGSSERILNAAHAASGNVWGVMSDPAFYQKILDGEVDSFTTLARQLGDELTESKPPYVAGDAREGFNPTHDVCRMMIDAAVRIARRNGAEVGNYAFFLFAPHTKAPRDGAICKTLTSDEMQRKVTAATSYPELASEVEAVFTGTSRNLFAQHPDLAAMIGASYDGISEQALAFECLVPADRLPNSNDEKPFYELYGERHVAAGTYARAIRYREHVQPIEHALAAL